MALTYDGISRAGVPINKRIETIPITEIAIILLKPIAII